MDNESTYALAGGTALMGAVLMAQGTVLVGLVLWAVGLVWLAAARVAAWMSYNSQTHTPEWREQRLMAWLQRDLPSPCLTVGHEYALDPDICDWCGTHRQHGLTHEEWAARKRRKDKERLAALAIQSKGMSERQRIKALRSQLEAQYAAQAAIPSAYIGSRHHGYGRRLGQPVGAGKVVALSPGEVVLSTHGLPALTTEEVSAIIAEPHGSAG